MLKSAVFLVFFINYCASTQDMSMYRTIIKLRDCLKKTNVIVCMKEKALYALNETIFSDTPINFYNMVEIEKNPKFHSNFSVDHFLPDDISQRSLKLTDILHDQVEEFFKSRVVKFNLAPAFEEGRKKDKGKGGMMMMAMAGMACMLGQMMMGKIAFLAGSALIIAKVALFLSGIVGLKKLAGGGGGGGETSHIVYASSDGHSHGGGGGGGWHRSLDGTVNNTPYRSYNIDNNYNNL